MFTEIITPRFLETDALGHINNNTYGIWFEAARDEFFRIFVPDSDIKKWNLVMAHSSYDFLKEVFWGTEVVIKTGVFKIGNSSIELVHAVYQNNRLCSTGKCIMIHYNLQSKKAMSIPSSIKEVLKTHLFTSSWTGTLEELDLIQNNKV